MVREVVHDVLFLGQKSEPATQADKQVAIDLLDTLKAHEEGCVGMAANMIGVKKRIIAVNMGYECCHVQSENCEERWFLSDRRRMFVTDWRASMYQISGD